MIINVAQLLKSTVGSTREYDIDDKVDLYEDGTEQNISGQINLLRTGRGILVQGTLHTRVEANCSRCLNTFLCPLDLKIVEEYFPTIDIITGNSISAPEDQPSSFTINQHHEIDLTEAVRQYAIMAMPMKPLCRADCSGICPTCGHNLNEKQCTCPAESIDPRWVKLLEKVNRKE